MALAFNILLLVFLTGNVLGKKQDNNQVVFSHHGRATREAAYTHMIAPLPIKELEAAANDLYDLFEMINKVSGTEGFLSNERHGIERNHGEDTDDCILSLQARLFEPFPTSTVSNNTIFWGIRGLPRRKRSPIPNAITWVSRFWSFPLHPSPSEPDS